MPVPVPDNVVFSYNGYQFSAYTKVKLTEEPVTSGDNRYVKMSKLTLDVSGWLTQNDVDSYNGAQNPPIAAGQPLDAFMLSLRRKLQVHGKTLIYENYGYGQDLRINDPSGQMDVWFGPKAGKFSFQSLGGMPDGCHAALFQWSVVTHIAECSSFSNNPGPNVFLEVSFTVTYETSELGIVTITYNGTAQIPLSLRGSNTLITTIDDSIGNIIKPPPVAFLRRMSRQLSADRASCTFSITDTQQEVVPPK